MKKRKVDIVVLSDIHLGTYGAHAKELCQYLKSIKPGILVLNGDIIDIWYFRKRFFPKEHMKVIRQITKKIAAGTPVYYITGNHDEMMRKFSGFKISNFEIVNKLVLDVGDKKAWIFHGDIFDASIHCAKWLAWLGGYGYVLLIWINRLLNNVLEMMGRPKMSLSKKVKDSVKRAVKYITDFENTAAELAIRKGYDYVICGHIHQPQMREITSEQGSVMYLNSGDWIENLTALEYYDGAWHMYTYNPEEFAHTPDDDGTGGEENITYEALLEELTVS